MLNARRGRAFSAIAAAWLVAGCGAAAKEPAPVPLPPAPKWRELTAARAWPLAVPRGPSSGHAPPRYTLEVRITPAESRPLYLDRASPRELPPGTRIAAFHESREGEPASVYVLEKLPDGQWRPMVMEPNGTLVQGDLGPCLSCHRDAPSDSVFGPRRPSREPAEEL